MSTRENRWRRPTDRRQVALIVLANLLPLAGYLSGAITLLEVVLVYAIEAGVVGIAVSAKLLVVEPPEGARERTLLVLDRPWLASPVRVTRWNVSRAAGTAGDAVAVLGVEQFLVLFFVAFVVSWSPSVAGLAAVSPASIVLASTGLVLVHVVEFGRFAAGSDRLGTTPDDVERQLAVVVTRWFFTMVVLAAATFGALVVPVASGDALLVAFVSIKVLVELGLGRERVEAMATD